MIDKKAMIELTKQNEKKEDDLDTKTATLMKRIGDAAIDAAKKGLYSCLVLLKVAEDREVVEKVHRMLLELGFDEFEYNVAFRSIRIGWNPITGERK